MDYLIRVLLDKSADLGVRDDATMDLGDHDGPQVLEALVQVAVDAEEHEMILNSCGESIGEIWNRRGSYNPAVLASLAPAWRSACNIGTARLHRRD